MRTQVSRRKPAVQLAFVARVTEDGVGMPQLLVHDRKDNVGVVVVEGVAAGDDLLAVITEDNSVFRIAALDDVPIGHKIALLDLEEGDTAIKYGQDIGRMIGTARRGGHVHVHNLKTKRW